MSEKLLLTFKIDIVSIFIIFLMSSLFTEKNYVYYIKSLGCTYIIFTQKLDVLKSNSLTSRNARIKIAWLSMI